MHARSSALVVALALGVLGSATAAHAHFTTFDGIRFDFQGTGDFSMDPVRGMVVTGIGSSGADGVALDLPDGARGALFDFEVGRRAGLGLTQQRTIIVLGKPNGGAELELFRVSIAISDVDKADNISVDATAGGAPGTVVEVVLAGEVVHREYVSPTTVFRVEEASGPGSADWSTEPTGRGLESRGPGQRAAIAIDQPGVKIVSESPTVQYCETDFDVAVRVRFPWLPDGVVGDALRFTRTTGTPIDRLTRILLTGTEQPGSGTGEIAINQPGVKIYDGIVFGAHVALGDLNADNEPPTITGFDSSGENGISISADTEDGHATDLGVTVDELQFVQPPTPGARLEAALIGSVGGAPPSVLTRLHVTRSAGDLTLLPDFSPLGATSWRATVVDDGVVVAELTGLTGSVGCPIAVESFSWKTVAGPVVRVRVGPADGVGVPFTFGPATYVGDAIELEPELPPGPTVEVADYFLKLELTAADLTELVLRDIVALPAPVVVTAVPEPGSATRSIVLRPSWPNPTRGGSTTEFALAAPGPVRATVLDLGGREVRTLVDHSFDAGSHRLTWDGRDHTGRMTAPGVYFIRIETGGAVHSAPVVRLR